MGKGDWDTGRFEAGKRVSKEVEKSVKCKLFSTFCINVKMQYILNQQLFLVKQYWITNSITATQRAYQREFGVRNPPKRNTILGLVNKLETTGSLPGVKRRIAMAKEAFNRKRSIFCGPLEKEVRKRLCEVLCVECGIVWGGYMDMTTK
ncbi:hypothetical protein ANN_02096 [Periplaneta americana]|uniref:DUF4817 domain-containing protein n=1 Tax=Periplaneta americana TaxID=6978 RepID=A0ABQ8TX43_PERAM|nr:hypothetical protein ANN_02096 [Periplaneta americana]